MDQPQTHRLSGYGVTTATVRIERDATGSSGAGVAISPRHIATCTHVVLDALGLEETEELPPGREITITVWCDGQPQPRKRAAPAEVTFWINGKEVTKGTVERTIPSGFTASETFDVGTDTNSPVANDYFDKQPFEFNGKIKRLHFKNL